MKNNSLKLNVSIITDKGKVRHNNEDNFIFKGQILEDSSVPIHIDDLQIMDDQVSLFGVFDGMGGHELGEKASLMTAQLAQNFLFDENYIEDGLLQICHQSNFLVCEEMRKEKVRIGTTASMIAFYEGNAYICNIGDTPIYLFRDNELIQLHEEHTERRMYEKLYGKVDPNKKYRLTQNIGVFEEEMMIQPYTNTIAYEKGDVFMICSDGLTDMVNQEDMISILSSKNSYKEKVLLDVALNAGGKDNTTIILIDIENKSIFDLFRK